ncbi:MAG: hypothetical protein JWL93_1818 [Hyphomicrobiales bacterium]|nr:hypothetical protein [Hyphomicrobiales bacterium]
MSIAIESLRAHRTGIALRTGIAFTLGLGLLTGTAGAVQAGFLDSLFGGQRSGPAYNSPGPSYDNYGYDHYSSPYGEPRQRRRGAQAAKPRKEAPPAKVEAICCKNGEDPMKALMLDTTLVAGDVVMTPEGMRTFVGSRAPHAADDFIDVSKSRLISQNQRRQLMAMDR